MAKPWEKYQESKPWEKYGEGEVLTPEPPGLAEQAQRQVGRTLRMGAETAGALPLMAMDPAMTIRNLLTDEKRPMPSQQFKEGLTAMGLPEAEGTIEKGVDIAGQMLLGSKIPMPKSVGVGQPAPSAFSTKLSQFSDDAVKQQTIRESMDAGYKIPPSSAKPTTANTMIESIGGKAQTQQVASVANQKVTNKLVRESLGLSPKTPLTMQTLKGVRDKAGQVYKKISSFGKIKTDEVYIDDLERMVQSIDDLAKDFPDANLGANKDIEKLVNSLLQDTFSAKGALEYTKQLRKDASSAFAGMYDPVKRALGHAQRAAADILEDQLSRHLKSIGHGELSGVYDKSRVLIAKTYSVQAALNEATGNVMAAKIGQQLQKGKPLSGGLELVGKFARTFPKAAEEIKTSPGVSALDVFAGFVGGQFNPALYALPFARYGARKGMMSKPFQESFVRTPQYQLPKEAQNIALPSAMLADALSKYKQQ